MELISKIGTCINKSVSEVSVLNFRKTESNRIAHAEIEVRQFIQEKRKKNLVVRHDSSVSTV